MKRLLIPILMGLGFAFAGEQKADSVRALPGKPVPRFNWSIGATFSPSLIGGYGEIVLRNVWAMQFQRYAYEAFEIPYGQHYSPSERYSMTSANVGAYLKVPHFKVGIFTGLGMADGVIHGKFLGSDSKECGMIGCTPSESRYETIEGKTLVVPIKLVLGYLWENVGFAFTPQVYFHGGRPLVNVPFSLEFGLP